LECVPAFASTEGQIAIFGTANTIGGQFVPGDYRTFGSDIA
jgi:hypothetical protein